MHDTEHTEVTTERVNIVIVEISTAWRKGVDAIFETGRLLLEAKEGETCLNHGAFKLMIEKQLPFGPRTAQMLMSIARHPVLSDEKYISHLPGSWATLHDLSRLPGDVVEKAIEEGRITRTMEQKDVKLLKIPRSLLAPPNAKTPAAVAEPEKSSKPTQDQLRKELESARAHIEDLEATQEVEDVPPVKPEPKQPEKPNGKDDSDDPVVILQDELHALADRLLDVDYEDRVDLLRFLFVCCKVNYEDLTFDENSYGEESEQPQENVEEVIHAA